VVVVVSLVSLVGRSSTDAATPPRPSPSSAAPTATPTPEPPFAVERVREDGPFSAGDWSQLRASDGSFRIYGQYPVHVVPARYDGWEVDFFDGDPACFLYVYDVPAPPFAPKAFTKAHLLAWVHAAGTAIGAPEHVTQGTASGWRIRYRHDGDEGELRILYSDGREFEFGYVSGRRSVADRGRRFVASFRAL
jgi:hypothetical protein